MVTFCRRNWCLLAAGAVIVFALAVFVIVWWHKSSELHIQPTSEEEEIASTFSASEKQAAMRLAIPKRRKMISEELSVSTDEYSEQNVATEQQHPHPHIAIQESAMTGAEESSVEESSYYPVLKTTQRKCEAGRGENMEWRVSVLSLVLIWGVRFLVR